jgi:hypothetical protein
MGILNFLWWCYLRTGTTLHCLDKLKLPVSMHTLVQFMLTLIGNIVHESVLVNINGTGNLVSCCSRNL